MYNQEDAATNQLQHNPNNDSTRSRGNRWRYIFSAEILDLKKQNAWISNHPKRKIFLGASIVFVLLWQTLFAYTPGASNAAYGRQDASGFTHMFGQHFVYYYYHLGLFPLATTQNPLDDSEEGARKSLHVHPDSLLMEYGHWARLGENLRIMLYLPNAYLKSSAKNPSIIPFNIIYFNLALIAVLVAFYLARKMLLGWLIVIFFGSSPFLLYETYLNENIFALMITTVLMILALNLVFFIKNPSGRYQWLIPLVSGALLGSVVNIRSEANVILVSCLFIYSTVPQAFWTKKSLLCGVFLLTFFAVKSSWRYYFDMKFNETYALVKKLGGNTYDGERIKTHTFWHPVFCGLGDFDTKYGYKWQDQVAYQYAIPILEKKYNMRLAWSGNLQLDEYYDSKKKYYKKIELIPEYEEVIKEKVLSDIKKDPWWFSGILARRITYVFWHTSPVWLAAGSFHISIPFTGLLLFPLVWLYYRKKRWFQLKLLVFSLPLAATSVIIYAKHNTTYNSCFHLFSAALIAAWIIEIALNRKRLKAS